jgi:hypothetical protein
MAEKTAFAGGNYLRMSIQECRMIITNAARHMRLPLSLRTALIEKACNH